MHKALGFIKNNIKKLVTMLLKRVIRGLPKPVQPYILSAAKKIGIAAESQSPITEGEVRSLETLNELDAELESEEESFAINSEEEFESEYETFSQGELYIGETIRQFDKELYAFTESEMSHLNFNTPEAEAEGYQNYTPEAEGYQNYTPEAEGYQNYTPEAEGYQNYTPEAEGYQNYTPEAEGYQNYTPEAEGYQNYTPEAEGYQNYTPEAEGYQNYTPEAEGYQNYTPEAEGYQNYTPEAEGYQNYTPEAEGYQNYTPEAEGYQNYTPEAEGYQNYTPEAEGYQNYTPEAEGYQNYTPEAEGYQNYTPEAEGYQNYTPEAEGYQNYTPEAEGYQNYTPEAEGYQNYTPEAEGYQNYTPEAEGYHQQTSMEFNSLEVNQARERFIQGITSNPANFQPEFEQLAPVLIAARVAMKIPFIRNKVLNLMAGLMQKLFGKWIPENIGKLAYRPLSNLLLKAMTLEAASEVPYMRERIASESVANIVTESVIAASHLPQSVLEGDQIALEGELEEIIKGAMINNLPPQVFPKNFSKTPQSKSGLHFIPRKGGYSSLNKRIRVRLSPAQINGIRISRGALLSDFLRQYYKWNGSSSVSVRVRVYQSRAGITRITRIAKANLGGNKRFFLNQLHPMTKRFAVSNRTSMAIFKRFTTLVFTKNYIIHSTETRSKTKLTCI